MPPDLAKEAFWGGVAAGICIAVLAGVVIVGLVAIL